MISFNEAMAKAEYIQEKIDGIVQMIVEANTIARVKCINNLWENHNGRLLYETGQAYSIISEGYDDTHNEIVYAVFNGREYWLIHESDMGKHFVKE